MRATNHGGRDRGAAEYSLRIRMHIPDQRVSTQATEHGPHDGDGLHARTRSRPKGSRRPTPGRNHRRLHVAVLQ